MRTARHGELAGDRLVLAPGVAFESARIECLAGSEERIPHAWKAGPQTAILRAQLEAMPDGGDSADDVMIVTDPVSGVAFEFCVYKQKRQVRYEVNLAWGVKMVAPRHCGILIGA